MQMMLSKLMFSIRSMLQSFSKVLMIKISSFIKQMMNSWLSIESLIISAITINKFQKFTNNTKTLIVWTLQLIITKNFFMINKNAKNVMLIIIMMTKQFKIYSLVLKNNFLKRKIFFYFCANVQLDLRWKTLK